MHVSSAFANCVFQEIDEIFYDYPFSTEDLSRMLNKLDDTSTEQLTARLLKTWPNTYSITKALAESAIKDYYRNLLPIGIFRPAIITSSWKEPIHGLIDNYYGPTGICAAAMMGVLRTLHCKGETSANIVPVDMCANALLAIAWDVGVAHGKDNCPIYNYVSTCDNPLTWNEYSYINSHYGKVYPVSSAVLPTKQFICHQSYLVHQFYMFVLHFIPALLLDGFGLVFGGRKPRLLRTHFKIRNFTKILAYFSTKEWTYSNGNVRRLIDRMSLEDKELFQMDVGKIDWLDYFRSYVLGIRRFLFKENDGTIEAARSRIRK